MANQSVGNLKDVIFGTDDPSVVATYGTIGDLYVKVSAPQGVFLKHTADGTDTDWASAASGSSAYAPAVPGDWNTPPTTFEGALDEIAAQTDPVYAPAVPGDWAPAPTTVVDGLDQLAARPISTGEVISIDSDATAGGAGTETVLFTGLLATDTVLSWCFKTNPQHQFIEQWTNQLAGSLDMVFSGDPGVSVIRIAILR